MSDELKYHDCPRDEREAQYDGRGIFLTYTCEKCHEAKMSRYRPEILEYYTQADVDEQIEEDY